jgi:hypothetical protein
VEGIYHKLFDLPYLTALVLALACLWAEKAYGFCLRCCCMSA